MYLCNNTITPFLTCFISFPQFIFSLLILWDFYDIYKCIVFTWSNVFFFHCFNDEECQPLPTSVKYLPIFSSCFIASLKNYSLICWDLFLNMLRDRLKIFSLNTLPVIPKPKSGCTEKFSFLQGFVMIRS